MNKKAQMIGQVFILVIAAIVFILILTYGYSAISNFIQSSEKVALLDFKSSLVSGVEQIKSDYGSVRKLSLRVPKKYQKLCIVSSDLSADVGSFALKYPVLFEAWQTGSENVFLVPKQDSPILIEDVVVRDGYFCTGISGGLVDLRVEGGGDKTFVSPW
ncbi:hypothetical protein GF358_00750 [Candidatus Woesearchaeota archaeon]|nr:hypothetical protein [Candidatus Woesearchaeota archaeon]